MNTYRIEKRHRSWVVLDNAGQLVCLTLYKKGALKVVRRLHNVYPISWN